MNRTFLRNDILENNFSYHAPTEGQPERYGELRETAKYLAYLILNLTPASREQSLAITKLEESVFWANAGIARNPTVPPETEGA
jgi:hypothetical protein